MSSKTTARPAIQRALLICGALSSVTYAAADLFGGLQYPGYSFRDNAISELMATGAPSEALVDPLFLLYDALLVLFGIGVIREARDNMPLRTAGALLLISAVVGVTGPTLFEMHPRTSGGVASDVPHIIATAVLVVLLLAAMGFGAWALGRAFRAYTFFSIALMLIFGALAGVAGAPLTRQEPTPWLGVLERINVYATMLWTLVLSIALVTPTEASSRDHPSHIMPNPVLR